MKKEDLDEYVKCLAVKREIRNKEYSCSLWQEI